MHITIPDVNYGLQILSDAMLTHGIREPSRNGEVLRMPYPVMVSTAHPTHRVLLCPYRRANPFLFLLDGLSVLSSVDLVKPLARIAPRFEDYSDDKVTLRGHYGRRLSWQIPVAIDMLRRDPKNRRVVLQIWEKTQDLDQDSNDIPCNVMVMPTIVHHKDKNHPQLDLTVINRSNDLFWGMMGANIVQFSFLQEYMALSLGVNVGSLHQVSTNLHAYLDMGPGKNLKKGTHPFRSPEYVGYPTYYALDVRDLVYDLNRLFAALAEEKVVLPETRNSFLNEVVYPMWRSWEECSADPLKERGIELDWFAAARMWWKE